MKKGARKKKLISTAAILVICSMLGFGLWRYSLTPFYSWSIEDRSPIKFAFGMLDELAGGSMLPRRMAVVEKKSFWPYATRYDLYWDSLTLINDESGISNQNTWVNVFIWNGYGVDKVKISGAESKILYFPMKKPKDTSVSAEGIKFQVKQNTDYPLKKENFLAVHIDPPLKKDKNLQVTVWDKYGNITEALVPVSSIIDIE